MGRRVTWEWKLSRMDEYGDIEDSEYEDTLESLDLDGVLSAVTQGDATYELALTRWTATECGHDVSWSTAYVVNGNLETETDAGYRVTKKLKAEFAALVGGGICQ